MKHKIIILGGGESGTGAAILAQQKGYDVFLSDLGKLKPEHESLLKKHNINYEVGKHTEEIILKADFVVKSPGVPKKAPVLSKIREAKIPIWSEIEFASHFTNKIIVAITGSNGKTTTTSLIAHILGKTNLNIGLGGNIGNSFAKMVAEDDKYDIYVLEISSFQLDDIDTFKPHIAILLNITPDHLDEYNYNISEYADAKFKITKNQTKEDYFLYNTDDEIIKQRLNNINAKALGFSLKDKNQAAYADEKELIIKYPDTFHMKIEEMALMGKHNVSNSLAAALNSNILKVRKKAILDSLTDFDAVEHRLEKVMKVHDIEFINDSKATNVNATFYALESMKTPTIWIVGGKDKGNDYSDLIPMVKKKVKAIVCLGIDNRKLIETFSPYVDQIVETDNMKNAVNAAYLMGKSGETVLLSPACASFDLFENYEQRGRLFKEEVKNL